MTKTMSIARTTLELVVRGDGRPLLFLHAGEGFRAGLASPVVVEFSLGDARRHPVASYEASRV